MDHKSYVTLRKERVLRIQDAFNDYTLTEAGGGLDPGAGGAGDGDGDCHAGDGGDGGSEIEAASFND